MYARNVILAALVLAGVAFAQTPIATDPPFQVGYVANMSAGGTSVYLSNSGANGAPLLGPDFGAAAGNICVNLYTMAPDEQLTSCCSCLLTPNKLVALGKSDLFVNAPPQFVTESAVIKLVATLAGAGGGGTKCDHSAAAVIRNARVPGALAWSTTVHQLPVGGYTIRETPFLPASLSPGELASLGGRCATILARPDAVDICPSCGSLPCTLNVSCPPNFSLVTAWPHTEQIPVTGNTPPFYCDVSGLPSGFTSDRNACTITGDGTTQPGAYPYTIKVTDSSSPACSKTINCEIVIPPPPVLPLVYTCPAPFCVAPGQSVSVPVAVQGGTPPYYNYSALRPFTVDPGLPPDLQIGLATPTSGLISGTVNLHASPGTYDYWIQVFDSSTPPQVSLQSGICTLMVSPVPQVGCPVLTARGGRSYPVEGEAIDPAPVPVWGGTPPYTVTQPVPSWGLTINPNVCNGSDLKCIIRGTLTTNGGCKDSPTGRYTITYQLSVSDNSPGTNNPLCPRPQPITCSSPVICDP